VQIPWDQAMTRAPERPELAALIAREKVRLAAMSSDELTALRAAQRESCISGEDRMDESTVTFPPVVTEETRGLVERLTAERDEARQNLKADQNFYKRRLAELALDGAQKRGDEALARAKAAESALAASQAREAQAVAERDRAVEALKPFDIWMDWMGGHANEARAMTHSGLVTFGDYRRVR